MPNIYLSPRSGFNIRMCDPTVPCPPAGGYDPAAMGWANPQPSFDQHDLDADFSTQPGAWIDDGGAWNAVEPPVEPPTINPYLYGMAGRRRRWEREELIRAAILAKRKKDEEGDHKPFVHAPFAPMALLQEMALPARREFAARPPTIGEITRVVSALVVKEPAIVAPQTVNAAVDAFDLDEDEEDEMIGRLWFTGKLFTLQ